MLIRYKLVSFFLVGAAILPEYTSTQNIQLSNNGYENVVAAIGDCVDAAENPNLIFHLKRLLSQFSSSLYVATDKRAYVRDVTILVPASWDNKGYGVANGESFATATFRVDEENPMFGVQPRAVEDPPELQCEHGWDHIHLTPEYVKNFRTDRDYIQRRTTDCITSCSEVDEQDFGGANHFASCRSCTEFAVCTSQNSAILYNQCGTGTVFDGDARRCSWSSTTCGVMELVHEWGHYRWALGDEHPHEGDNPWYQWDAGIPEQPHLDSDGTMVFPNRCTHSLSFQPPSCSQKEGSTDTCTFLPSYPPDASAITEGSVMFDLNSMDLPHVNKFCGNNTSTPSGHTNRVHNHHSQNDHQRRCGIKSAWEVMNDHIDFEKGANPYRGDVETQPTFKIIQQRVGRSRVVLVLDVSGSMTDTNERGTLLESMNQDAASYIQNAPDGSYIGIVSFSTSADELIGMSLTPDYTGDLIDALPPVATGGTCISCGIRKGMEVLIGHNENASSGRILIITDGQHNSGDPVDSVTNELVEAGIFVDSILYTANADLEVRRVSEATGGLTFSDDGTANSTLMIQGLLDVLNQQVEACADLLSVPVLTEAAALQRNVETVLQAVVDSSVGHNTRFSFTHPPSLSNPLSVTLVDPTGNQFASTDGVVPYYNQFLDAMAAAATGSIITEHNQALGTLTMTVNGQADFGRWTIKMTNTHSSQNFGSQVLVTSTPSSPDAHPITASAALQGTQIDLSSVDPTQKTVRMFCTMRQGHAPILDASVVALVDSSYEVFTVRLEDDGLGIDAVANDGVYSAPFVQFTRNGRYSVSVEARNSDSTASIVTKTTPGKRWKRSDMKTSSLGLFERVSAAGFFTVEGHTETPGEVPNVVPPARVNDLRFVQACQEEQTVEIRWTAVGADLFEGTAHRYELRHNPNSNKLRDDFDNCSAVSESNLVIGSLSSPSMSGEMETLIFQVTKEQLNKTENYALRVYDDGGLYSDISNVARVFIPTVIPMDDPTTEAPPPPPPTPGLPGTTTTPRPPRTSAPVTEAPEESSEPNLALIIGSVCAALLTGLLIAVIILIIRVQKAGKSKSKPGLLSEFSSQASDSVSKGTGSLSLPSPPATYPGYTPQVMMAPPEYPPQLHPPQLHPSQLHPAQLHHDQLNHLQLNPAQLYSTQLSTPGYQGEMNRGYEYDETKTYAAADLTSLQADRMSPHPHVIPRASVTSSRGCDSIPGSANYGYRY